MNFITLVDTVKNGPVYVNLDRVTEIRFVAEPGHKILVVKYGDAESVFRGKDAMENYKRLCGNIQKKAIVND